MNLIERIEYEMSTDDYSKDKISRQLKRTYTCASDAEKAIIDSIFISLCGFSLQTLLNR